MKTGLLLAVLLAVIGCAPEGELEPDDIGSSEQPVLLSGVTGTVNVSGLNLRTGPSTANTIIRVLPFGTPFTALETNGDWFRVTTGGSTGWISSFYVLLNSSGSTVYSRGNTARRMVALTFDAGSDLGHTDLILDLLETYGVRASFGLTGNWAQANPDAVERIFDDGIQLIDHSLSHPSFTGLSTGAAALSPARQLSQLVITDNILASITGVRARPWWRPPYGDYNAGVLLNVGAAGYTRTAMWTLDSLGWAGLTADQIFTRVVNNTGNGSIILMHVGGQSADAFALERIILNLRARGFTFGTVSDVIAP